MSSNKGGNGSKADDPKSDHSHDLGIAERTRRAVELGVPLTQAQMLGLTPFPESDQIGGRDGHE